MRRLCAGLQGILLHDNKSMQLLVQALRVLLEAIVDVKAHGRAFASWGLISLVHVITHVTMMWISKDMHVTSRDASAA